VETVDLALRLVLTAVFATAGVGKLLDREGSIRALSDFGVGGQLGRVAGTALPYMELAVAVALVFPPTAIAGAIVAVALLLGFIVGIGRALLEGSTPDCHCFGQIHSSPAGPKTLIRNGVLAAMALLILIHGAGTPLDDWVAARSAAELAAVCLGIAAVFFAGLSLWLWNDRRDARTNFDIVQAELDQLPPGLPVGLRAPNFMLEDMRGQTQTLASLTEGGVPTMLVFTGPRCTACKAMMPDLARWQRSLKGRLEIAVMTGGTEDENRPLVEEHGLENVILQTAYEVMYEYRVRATPTAIVIGPDFNVASLPATGAVSIEPLIRVALARDTVSETEAFYAVSRGTPTGSET
jgi:uncharacterized membrane protein YphA (DoxX/SURF4 family)/thiol-disulfide isomerase/thioredoxin